MDLGPAAQRRQVGRHDHGGIVEMRDDFHG